MTPEIVKVAREFGLTPVQHNRMEYRCPCPFHRPQSSEPTLMFGKDKFGWVFACWMCGARGRDRKEFEAFYNARKEAKDGEALPE